MTWALSHRHATGTKRMAGADTVRWPRGLTLIGLLSLLVAAWGGIVPFVGPTFQYPGNGGSSWHWTNMHAWLYVVPGGVGVLASLAVMSRPRTGRILTRMSLFLLGLILVACGAWFVIGPSAWPTMEPGVVFPAGQSATDHLLTVVGYNYGVGLVLVALGAMVVNAGIAEREVPLNVRASEMPAFQAPTSAAPTSAADPTIAQDPAARAAETPVAAEEAPPTVAGDGEDHGGTASMPTA